MKSYTDLEQSRKLSEILPTESADMSYRPHREEGGISDYQATLCPHRFASWIGVPCWSLSALLDVLPKKYYPVKDHETNLILGKPKDKWCALYWDTTGMQDGEETLADNPIDACYEMILKLHELKRL